MFRARELFIATVLCVVPFWVACANPQEKQSKHADNVPFEMSTLNWSIYESDGCRRILDLRLYSDRRIEYQECRRDVDHRSGFLITKEAKVDQDDVDELVRLIETSGFLDANGPAHSGINLVDAGWNTTLIYRAHGAEKRLEVRNYLPESKTIPEWVHGIIAKARSLIAKPE